VFIIPSDCLTCCDIDWLIAGDAISATAAAAINANFFIGPFPDVNESCPYRDNAPGLAAVPCCAAIISGQCCAEILPWMRRTGTVEPLHGPG
jgi:hypothetical protein